MKKTVFVCQNCGYQSPRWLGKCLSCGEWNSLVEEEVVEKRGKAEFGMRKTEGGRRKGEAKPVRLNELSLARTPRQLTGISELDRVLGGGIVPGSLLLLGGEPGIGKSTLILQVCHKINEQGKIVLYITGEESPEQVRVRAARLGANGKDLFLLATVDIEDVLTTVEEINPEVLVIDSIQTLATAALMSPPGSVAQVRECTAFLLRLAKSRRLTTFIIGHVTKFGAIAGPKTLEHMVDTVLYFEGEASQNYRIVRTVKNRYGPTNEIGVFEMSDTGLVEVPNPSRFFLAGRRSDISGSAVVCALEGTRPLLVEIQALAATTHFSLPQRVVSGFDFRRLALLLSVLERRAGISTANKDIFLNIAGGFKITEPASDLGVVVALASAIRNIPLPEDIVFLGEVGLAGEVRAISRTEERVNEAARLGFKKVFLPERNQRPKKSKIAVVSIDTITTALKILGLKR
ncbi:MAG: DNA repair protein RadA [candidate division WOR-3 bacterium]